MTDGKDQTPDTLRPYIFHGVDLQWRARDKEAIGECPWCHRAGKFSVNIETGVWRCVVCDEGVDNGKSAKGGNAYVFVRMLHAESDKTTAPSDYIELATERKLLFPETLIELQIARSTITGEWLVPGYNPDGKLMTLYKYGLSTEGRRKLLWPTPTLGHRLLAMNLFDAAAETIYVLEGWSDLAAFFEVARCCKPGEHGSIHTSNRDVSYMNNASVIGIPAAKTYSVFTDECLALFGGKDVVLLGHNDHERADNNGKRIGPASWEGMREITKRLDEAKEPPRSVKILGWNEHVGYNLDLPTGYDVRDKLAHVR